MHCLVPPCSPSLLRPTPVKASNLTELQNTLKKGHGKPWHKGPGVYYVGTGWGVHAFHVASPDSFEDLRTVGEEVSAFRAMACKVMGPKYWVIIEDPFTTPGAHLATVILLSLTAVFMMLGLVGVVFQSGRRNATASDELHIFFWLFGAVGYACAGIAKAVYTAHPNPLLLIARLLLVTSWLGLLGNRCLLY